MSKTITENLIKEIEKRKIVIGPKVTLKKLKEDKIEKIYLSEDCLQEILNKIKKVKNKIEIIKLKINQEDLREICKKSFNISVISILKEKIKKKETRKKTERKEVKKKVERKTRKKKGDEKEK